jgi:hypothetical protein
VAIKNHLHSSSDVQHGRVRHSKHLQCNMAAKLMSYMVWQICDMMDWSTKILPKKINRKLLIATLIRLDHCGGSGLFENRQDMTKGWLTVHRFIK